MSTGEEMFDTHDCGGDAAAYVLGALEPAQAQRFRQHLEECAVCRDEVEAFGGVVEVLPMAAPQHAVPRRLRRRVLRAVRADSRARAAGTAAARRRPPLRLAAVTAAAVVVVALAVIGSLRLTGSGGHASRVIQARVMGISGSAQLRLTADRGELVVNRLSPPPAGEVYEVWLKAPHAAPVPASVLFSVSSSGAADVTLPRTLRGVSELMVTPEPDGGTTAPTHAAVIVATVA